MPLIPAVNLARTLERLKAAGFWCCGLDERAPQLPAELASCAVALVLGAEGDGCAAWCGESCDYPRGCRPRRTPSLNVSTAAAVALYALQGRSGG